MARKMGICEVCGNDYDKAFEVLSAGERFMFDSLECAAHKLAPRCAHCECQILGHGVEIGDAIYCCAHCARMEGKTGVRDRSEDRKTA